MLKFEDIAIGTYIKAFDFPPIKGRRDCFIEGTITGVSTERGYKAYTVDVEFDSWDDNTEVDQRSRNGSVSFVPMESSHDFDERITVLTKHPIEEDEDSANAVQWTDYGFRG